MLVMPEKAAIFFPSLVAVGAERHKCEHEDNSIVDEDMFTDVFFDYVRRTMCGGHFHGNVQEDVLTRPQILSFPQPGSSLPSSQLEMQSTAA